MKALFAAATMVAALTILLTLFPATAFSHPVGSGRQITQWELKWETGRELTPGQAAGGKEIWSPATANDPLSSKPHGATGVWIRFVLPEVPEESGILIDKLYGQNILIFIGQEKEFENSRTYYYDYNRILLPLSPADGGRTVLIHARAITDSIGLTAPAVIGNYGELSAAYAKADLIDIILGCAFLFVAIVMLVCSIFLNKEQLRGWVSLSLVILSVGIMIVMYSPFLYTFYGQYGQLYQSLFDAALMVFMPSLTFFFGTIFGNGYFGIIRIMRLFQTAYSGFGLLCVVLNLFTPYLSYHVYHLVTVLVPGIEMMLQFLIIIGIAVLYAIKGDKDAAIISAGFGLFAVIGTAELGWYYFKDQQYDLHFWKWGVVGFIFSLIVLLGKRFAHNHRQIVKYTKELEMYNHQLQRSEKMEVISQLAASVAHEVRNPLQVTRGFLQLLGDSRYEGKEKSYLNLAIEELDRAATIITNYLTFAKPQLEEVTVLNLADELGHVEGILEPLANLQGGKIEISVPSDLHVYGNASKLKQALINIMKNSIEALRSSGRIHVWAYESKGEVVIHIRDNGEGMDESMVKRLGEPYFSNKTKGTGLGLMVTFRIIELMQGKLEFNSRQGVGTEAVIRFPIAKKE